MPVRTIPRSYRNVTGRIAIPGSRSVAFESTLERDFILVSLFTPGFAGIEEQPVAIPQPKGRRPYTPDFLVTWVSRQPDLVEVKPADEVQEMAGKAPIARSYAEERGWRFNIVTDKQIRTPRLENARFLLPFRRHTPDPAIVETLFSLLGRPVGDGSIKDLVGAAALYGICRERSLPALWHLISTFQIAADLDTLLMMTSVVKIARKSAA
jgi:hypothetical protein